MDFVKNALGGGDSQNESNNPQGQSDEQQQQQQQQGSSGGGGFLGDIGDKLNNMAGRGKDGEKNEDYLDKGIDAVQQYALGQGKQNHDSAVEQVKDEQISEFIRDKYKSTSGTA